MSWQIYNITAWILLAGQLLLMLHIVRNYRYAIRSARRKRDDFRPVTLVTAPCKGIDACFDDNIRSLLQQDYAPYDVHFVVESESDPAYAALQRLRDEAAGRTRARTVRIQVAGISEASSQKIHNLLHSVARADENVEVLAFADSDVCMKPDWLAHLTAPLRREKNGASTGYRWYIPPEPDRPSSALSVLNGIIGQMLGNTRFNLAWGGSMAIRRTVFYEIGVDRLWQSALSDDLCLTYAVKKAGRKIVFAPGCIVPSYEGATWSSLCEFARRQFLITRITVPGNWWFGLLSSIYSLLGSWGALFIAMWAVAHPQEGMLLPLYVLVPLVFFFGQFVRAIVRQRMIARLLPEDARNMKPVARTDILATGLWSWMLLAFFLASAVGRTITWRGVTYRMVGRTEVEILERRPPRAAI